MFLYFKFYYLIFFCHFFFVWFTQTKQPPMSMRIENCRIYFFFCKSFQCTKILWIFSSSLDLIRIGSKFSGLDLNIKYFIKSLKRNQKYKKKSYLQKFFIYFYNILSRNTCFYHSHKNIHISVLYCKCFARPDISKFFTVVLEIHTLKYVIIVWECEKFDKRIQIKK